jgi:shikimate dehydrogenase
MKGLLSFTELGCGQTPTGMISRYAVLGSPIEHSKSPQIHNAIFNSLGTDASYERFEIASDLASWVSRLDDSWRGLSITMPLKTQALNLAKRVDPLAIAAQSANTLIRHEDGWDAYNTDVMGIQLALAGAKFSSVCVLGTGATARSAIVAMLEKGKTVSIWGRDFEKVSKLAVEFGIEPILSLHTALSQPAVISTLTAHALDEVLQSDYNGYLLDVIYNPWPTVLAEHFPNGKVVSGLEMLLWQAIGQQRLFSSLSLEDQLPNEAILLSAARSAINMPK